MNIFRSLSAYETTTKIITLATIVLPGVMLILSQLDIWMSTQQNPETAGTANLTGLLPMITYYPVLVLGTLFGLINFVVATILLFSTGDKMSAKYRSYGRVAVISLVALVVGALCIFGPAFAYNPAK